jgi:hypothetical protein
VLDLRVFGSRARGDAAPDSDLDVFIELEESTPELRQRISEIAWEVGFERECLISTVVTTRDELEQGALGASPLRSVCQKAWGIDGDKNYFFQDIAPDGRL